MDVHLANHRFKIQPLQDQLVDVCSRWTVTQHSGTQLNVNVLARIPVVHLGTLLRAPKHLVPQAQIAVLLL